MSGIHALDWASLAVSFFNTCILIWLGFTVLLNSDRRNWGVWLAAGGLLTGAVFFISHSAILGQARLTSTRGLNFWWHAGWGPVVAAPYAWYMLMLWYTGFWETHHSNLARRHAFWLPTTMLFTLALSGLFIFGNPLPTLALGAQFDFAGAPSLLGMPLLLVAYPVYILLCIALSLDALLHPAPSPRPFANVARRRARPWLTGATLLLLGASVLVGAVLLFIINASRLTPDLIEFYNRTIFYLSCFDVLIAALIGAAVLMLGRAMVAYEIFTGHSLPRQALLKHWRRAVVLCGGISVLFAWVLVNQLRPIYALLLAAGLMVTFYALVTWRSFTDRDAVMRQLRPFAASQGLYNEIVSGDHLNGDKASPESLFIALVQDVLNARQAALIPLGALAGLTQALIVPQNARFHLPTLEEVQERIKASRGILVPGANPGEWIIPLWNAEGLVGALLLTEKVDGGFYSQEEVEIARASGERLLDTRASAEMARRLVALQYDRMTQSAIIDRRTRRVLHDDVLPRLHTALLLWSSQPGVDTAAGQQSVAQLADAHRDISALLRDTLPAPEPELSKKGIVNALRSVIENEMTDSFDRVEWRIDPDAEAHFTTLPESAAEVLFYAAREAVRNAARHARGSETTPKALHLMMQIDSDPTHWFVSIEDNGVGISSTSPKEGGAGHGLTLHSTLMAVISGSLSLESEPGRYTRVTLKIPRSRYP